MFTGVCISDPCSFRGWVSLVLGPFQEVGWVCRGGYFQGWVCPGGEYPPPDMRPGIPQDMVGKRVVRGWCFLVLTYFVVYCYVNLCQMCGILT